MMVQMVGRPLLLVETIAAMVVVLVVALVLACFSTGDLGRFILLAAVMFQEEDLGGRQDRSW